ncbi:snaclec convulxin subunit beta-like isoform X2 [Artemia franciscana]|uniref:snaclec convulxin subunit beta-like isoform X2 n=1 Tax=Artemia franciscana TaxID=6661 RepID=UPI0032DB944A
MNSMFLCLFALLNFSCLSFSQSGDVSCPNEKCYERACFCYSVKSRMFWGSGVAICKSEGAEMVSITSDTENKHILSLTSSNTWIGTLYGSKYWVDGENVEYKNWYPASFDGHTVGYISPTYSGFWYTISSLTTRLTVVCKWQKNPGPAQTSSACPTSTTDTSTEETTLFPVPS